MNREWRALVPRAQRNHRREVATDALSRDRDPRWVAADVPGVGHHELDRGIGVVDRRRKRMLGRLAVSDRGHDAASSVRQRPARGIVGVKIRDHEPPAVEVDEDRQGVAFHTGRAIDPGQDLAFGTGNQEMVDPADGLLCGQTALRDDRAHGVRERRQVASDVGRDILDRWRLERGEGIEHLLHLGIGGWPRGGRCRGSVRTGRRLQDGAGCCILLGGREAPARECNARDKPGSRPQGSPTREGQQRLRFWSSGHVGKRSSAPVVGFSDITDRPTHRMPASDMPPGSCHPKSGARNPRGTPRSSSR
ncbi:MAG: hypothetical protein AVDCRST_MAG87-1577 [uncultured Thermomicrobiales bacterium]|uniref:Uncharacterized protein n=1 Tax=uncultured Thermomicrobiales bacterium TaxID=1645740 RepID=A0A6J4UXP4_9BACT|nr:MAG: hypothetical protein AVDCRST_MAG87-1577 [uncultured Thermomicrobiales bacterium]